jgi:putative ABC transport system ATP-binding protein
VLADEPTAHLDYVQVEGVLRLIRRLTDGGRVVVVSTHDDRMLPLADQIIEMRPNFLPVDDAAPTTVTLEPGGYLFRQGDPSDRIYMVEHGRLEVVRDTPDGELVLGHIEEGTHVGEMGPLFGLPRSASVRALAPTTLTGYTAKAFRDLVGADNLPNLIRAGR